MDSEPTGFSVSTTTSDGVYVDGTFGRGGHKNEGRVVGLFRGRMEAGPRALGHRSLLADPRNRFQVRHPSGYIGPAFSVAEDMLVIRAPCSLAIASATVRKCAISSSGLGT